MCCPPPSGKEKPPFEVLPLAVQVAISTSITLCEPAIDQLTVSPCVIFKVLGEKVVPELETVCTVANKPKLVKTVNKIENKCFIFVGLV